MKSRWTGGNRVRLLENGEEFFPAVFAAIRAARREVILETFILFEDKVGQELHAALLEAARRGVQVDVMVDGFGSSDLTPGFIGTLAAAGVRVRTFDPCARVFGMRFNVLRRMHRKLVIVDGQRAFVGGINYSADHLADFGPQAKQDYAVELEGPIVAEIHGFAAAAIHPAGRRERWLRRAVRASPAPQARWAGPTEVTFVTRDNVNHRNDIERHYRAAIRSARKRVLIANAYFFPGYRLLRELRRAAKRGVDVRLILQGEPDMPIVKQAAMMLYEPLQRAGVKIHEYCERPLHGKVAVVDDDWSTVGSSNLDPLSLSLNLEANVILRDAAFAAHLRARLEYLIEHQCRQVAHEPASKWRLWQELRTFIVFHFLRRFPVWAGHLPRHEPTLELPQGTPGATPPEATRAAPVGAMSAEPQRGAQTCVGIRLDAGDGHGR
ncbi:MAG: cardiolipin synthase ClsB [Burkholderiaceae bacterium]